MRENEQENGYKTDVACQCRKAWTEGEYTYEKKEAEPMQSSPRIIGG